MPSYIYIMSNKKRTTLYIGVTNNLERRVLEHKLGDIPGFTKRYSLTELVYFEEGGSMIDAITREKQLKRWHKEWKWNLVKGMNPTLADLSDGWYDSEMIKTRS